MEEHTFLYDHGVPDVGMMAKWDFVLDMTTLDIAEAFVGEVIPRGSPEDRARLATMVRDGRHVDGRFLKHALRAFPEYSAARSLVSDLAKLDSDDPEVMDIIERLNQFLVDLAQNVAGGEVDDPPTFPGLAQLRRRFFPDSQRSRTQKGGGPVPDDVSDMEINYYRVMQLGDAIHDFADDEPNEDLRPELEKDLGVVMPKMHVPIVQWSEKTQFRKPTLSEIADKSRFVELMTKRDEVQFGPELGPNPLHGKSFEKGMYHHKPGGNETKKSGYRLVDGNKHHFELFSYRDENCSKHLPLLKLCELVEIRDKIRAAFDVAELKFMVDQNALLGHPGDERPLPFIVAWMLGFKNTIKAIMTFHKVEGDATELEFGTLYSCDASVHDRAKFKPSVFSPDATGDVFHEVSMVNLKFDGAPTKDTYGFVLESKRGCPIDIFDHESKRTSIGYDVAIGKNGRKEAIDRDTGVTHVLNTGQERMSDKIAELKLEKKNCAVALALKLAGDWGQIEHCKRKGWVFVTADKLASLYAVYRDVPLLYLNHNDSFKVGKGDRSFLQYSFVMADRQGDEPVETFVPAPVPTTSAGRRVGHVGLSTWCSSPSLSQEQLSVRC
jgi:hypothetical protein